MGVGLVPSYRFATDPGYVPGPLALALAVSAVVAGGRR